MQQRKIQLVAGSTYSVSLPKEWVKTNNLREQSLVTMHINDDNSLLLLPDDKKKISRKTSFSLNIDELGQGIEQVLFSLYYAGFEDIELSSSQPIQEDIKSSIKKKIRYMSGTEIIYEDDCKIYLKVLLDTHKLNIKQIFFRVALIINSSIDSLIKNPSLEILEMNEEEIDRLYHLLSKILSLSSFDHTIMKSSHVFYSAHIVPYSIIARKLENIADNIYFLSKILEISSEGKEKVVDLLEIIGKTIRTGMIFLMGERDCLFEKTSKLERERLKKVVKTIDDDGIRLHLLDSLRYTFDIEEELMNISFYQMLIKEGQL